jgi:hypothetical protein
MSKAADVNKAKASHSFLAVLSELRTASEAIGDRQRIQMAKGTRAIAITRDRVGVNWLIVKHGKMSTW